MPPVLFINGAPRSGKDTLANHIRNKLNGFGYVQASRFLKEQANALYGRPDLPWYEFELNKDEPNDFFLGLTPREAWIGVSERYMKPTHGDEVYGNMVLRHIVAHNARAWILDCGYLSEAMPVIRVVGAEKCRLIRIHAKERGCNFQKDSRSHIELPGVEVFDIHNNGTKGEFLSRAYGQLEWTLQQMVGGE
jgi:nicotinamide riboside kinase